MAPTRTRSCSCMHAVSSRGPRRERTTGTRDEQYNVISVLYHALQGADTCATYLQDAEHAGDQELAQFFREVRGTYRQLADRGKTLLRQRLR
jgi:hypothetical protein